MVYLNAYVFTPPCIDLQYRYRTMVVSTAQIKCNSFTYLKSNLHLYSTQVICRLIHEQRDQGYFPRLNWATLVSVPECPKFTGSMCYLHACTYCANGYYSIGISPRDNPCHFEDS